MIKRSPCFLLLIISSSCISFARKRNTAIQNHQNFQRCFKETIIKTKAELRKTSIRIVIWITKWHEKWSWWMVLPGAISRRVASIPWWKGNMFGDFSNPLREPGNFKKKLWAALRTEWWKCGSSPQRTLSLDFVSERERRASAVGLMMGRACCKYGLAQSPCFNG